MKKVLISFFAVSFFILGNNILKVKAEYNNLENLLDLNKIAIFENPPSEANKYTDYYLRTLSPIPVEKGKTYTLVLSKYLFDDRSWGQDPAVVIMRVYYSFTSSSHPDEGAISEAEYGQKGDFAYFTFVAEDDLFQIIEMPFEVNKYTDYLADIMLFAGGIEKFAGEITSFKTNFQPINWVYLKDFETNITTEEIIATIKGYDEIDQEIDYTIINDEYTPNKDKMGEFIISLMVVNSSHIRSFCDILVKVVDITPPFFIGKTEHILELDPGNMPDYQIVTADIDVRDNYTNVDRQEIKLISENYSKNKNKVGTYTVVYEIEDQFSNKTQTEITIKVVDTTKPVITGPKMIYRYSTDEIITEEELRSYYSVTDSVDGDITDNLEITGSSEKTPGTYEYTLKAKDSNNNVETKIITVNVVNGKQPHFSDSDNYIIAYGQYEGMSHDQIKEKILSKIEGATNINIILDETLYKNDKTKPMYVYYSYVLDNQQYYDRIIIEPEANINVLETVIFVSLIVLNIGFGIAYFKRPILHLGKQ